MVIQGLGVCDLPHAIKDIAIIKAFVVCPKTITSFLNIRMASAPIQKTAASVKYKMIIDEVVQAISLLVLFIPIVNASNMKKRAMHNCAWNLLASLTLSFL